jgi:hypothetical protein
MFKKASADDTVTEWCPQNCSIPDYTCDMSFSWPHEEIFTIVLYPHLTIYYNFYKLTPSISLVEIPVGLRINSKEKANEQSHNIG